MKQFKKLHFKWSWFKYNLTRDRNEGIKYDLSYWLDNIYREGREELGIHKVEVKREFYQIKIIIYLERPGLLIGLKGSKIKLLTEKMEQFIGQNISIQVREYNPLPNVYYFDSLAHF